MCETRFYVFSTLAVGLAVIGLSSSQAATVTLQAGTGGQPADIIQEAMLVQDSGNDNFGARGDVEAGVLGNGRVRTTVMRFDVTDPSLGLYNGGVPQFSVIDAITLTMTTTGNTNNSNNMDLRVAAGVEAQGDWVEGTGTSASLPDTGTEADTGQVTYTERQEAQSTPWLPDTNYTRGIGDGVLGSITVWPGTSTSFDISFSPVAGETLTDLVNRWATGNNEGVLINDFNRSGFARWFMYSSETGTIANRPLLTIEYTAIPEPSTLCLAALGLLSLGFVGWRRKLR